MSGRHEQSIDRVNVSSTFLARSASCKLICLSRDRILRAPGAIIILPRAMERVVVADDNPSMTRALQVVLELWGWDVSIAHDGWTAIEAIRATRPAVALIDIGLPELSGLEVARFLRAEGAAPPLMVALSGYGEEQDRRRSQEAGFDRHLVKPVDPEILRALLTPVGGQVAGNGRRVAGDRPRL